MSEPRIIELDDRSKIYAEVTPGIPGKGVFVLVNDLLTAIRATDSLTESLARHGFTVIRYAFRAQPESLRLLDKGEEPRFLAQGLELEDMARELDEVLTKSGIDSKVNLVGMSYGAAVAAEFASRHPDRVETTILLAPVVDALDHFDPNGRGLRTLLSTVRFWENSACNLYGAINPAFCLKKDFWYDSFYRIVHENQPTRIVKNVPTGVDESVFKKSVFHLLRAVRDFDLRISALQMKNVHLVVAGQEGAELALGQETAWILVNKTERRSFAKVKGASHDLQANTGSPIAVGEWLGSIAEKKESLQKGERFEIEADKAN